MQQYAQAAAAQEGFFELERVHMSKINDLEREVKADVKEATEAVSAENADKP